MEESLVNYTHVTTGSSNDGSFVALEADTGVLHLMGKEVVANVQLIQNIHEYTPYEVVEHVITPQFDYHTLVQHNKHSNVVHYYVLAEFDNTEAFVKMKPFNVRLIGVPVVFQCIVQNMALSSVFRKEHCTTMTLAMSNIDICFTNFTSKSELNEVRQLVRMMNGVIRPEYDPNNDEMVLVAHSAGRSKYESHSDLGRFPVKRKWIEDCYALRHDINLRPILLYLEDPKCYLCPVFYNLKIALCGFAKHDLDIQHITQLGATIVEYTDKQCTHMVIKRSSDKDVLDRITISPNPNLEIVNDLWLWECIATDQYLKPRMYKFPADCKRKAGDTGSGTPSKRISSGVLESSIIANSSVSSIVVTPEPKLPKLTKREMIIKEFIETEKSYVEHLTILEKKYYEKMGHEGIFDEEENLYWIFCKIFPIRIAHQALCLKLEKEMISTEREEKGNKKKKKEEVVSLGEILLNWTGRSIEEYDEKGKPLLLNPEEMGEIFKYDSNKYRLMNHARRGKDAERDRMSEKEKLVRKRQNMESFIPDIEKYRDCAGEVIEVLKVYMNYLTSFEDITKEIDKCRTKMKFKGHLEVEESSRENHRLSLSDLMIEPVQRLPRMILLINEILSKTAPSHPDYTLLVRVKHVFQSTTSVLNDRKREVDDKYELMGLLRDISGLPLDKMSSMLQLVGNVRAETPNDVGGTVMYYGQTIHLFLFSLEEKKRKEEEKENDEENKAKEDNLWHDSSLEIAKPRVKMGSIKSAAGLEKARQQYKHLLLVPLRAIKYVIDVSETVDGSVMFAITYVDPPPPIPTKTVDCKRKKMDEKKETSKEITLKFKLESAEIKTTWIEMLAEEVKKSYTKFNIPLENDDTNVKCTMPEHFVDDVISKETNFKERSNATRDLLNFAKRSMTRAFSQKHNKFAMRKTQSQFGISSTESDLGKYSGSSSGSVRFPKRTMRDSH